MQLGKRGVFENASEQEKNISTMMGTVLSTFSVAFLEQSPSELLEEGAAI